MLRSMKITLDHNCLINLERGTETARYIRKILTNESHECFVVNVGASEMLQFGVTPDNYGKFEEFLSSIGLEGLPRLNPLGIFGLTFFDRCLFAGDDDVKLLSDIREALFPSQAANTPNEYKARNETCDVLTMWCHISQKHDVFLTSDSNFRKLTKMPKLLDLGAGHICAPAELARESEI
jgi:hypothetical protein